jgi:hypothetical protein
MLGLGSSLAKGGASLLTFVKDNLKLYLDFNSKKSDTLKFPSEGSTEFDGTNDRIDVSATLSSGTYTVMGWVYKTRQDGAYFIDFRKDSGTGYIAFSNNANNSIYSASGTKYINGVEGTTVPLNTWTHVCVSGITISSSTTKIGCQNNDTNFFKGSITNVALWSRELTPEEIQSIMNKSYSQLKGVEKTSSLVSWWAMDDTVSTEKITNGDFSVWTNDNPDGWTISTDLSGGVESDDVKITEDANGARIYSTGTNIHMTQNVMTIGATYEVTIVVHSVTTGDITTQNLSSNLSINSAGTHTVTTTATATGFRIKRNFPVDMVISSVSVKEVQSNDSKGSNNGAIIGATTTTSVYGGNAPILPRAVDVAKEGQADAIGDGSASFNGSTDYIDLGDSTDFDITNSITLSAWIKVDAINQHALLAGRDDGTNRNYYLELYTDEKIYWTCNGLSDTQVVSSTTISANEWYHIAGTYDGSNLKLYINGILEDSDASTGSIDNDDVSFTIGAREAGVDRRLDGNISQVGIWQGALTQSQIQSVMESTSYSKIPADVKSTLGSELVQDSDWQEGTGWTDTGDNTWTYTSGTTSSLYIENVSGLTIGNLYKIQYTITSNPDNVGLKWGGINFFNGNVGINSAVGTHTYYGVATTDDVAFRHQSGTGTIGLSNPTLKEVTNDIVAYYPLDGSSSANGVTQDVTTGETLGSNTFGGLNQFVAKGSAETVEVSGDELTLTIASGNDAGMNTGNLANLGLSTSLGYAVGDLAKLEFQAKSVSVGSGNGLTLRVYDVNGYVFSATNISLTSEYQTFTIYGEISSLGYTIPSILRMGNQTGTDVYKFKNFSVQKVTSNTGVLK